MSNLCEKQLIKLIKACRASGVANLKVGEIEITFQAGETAMKSVVEGDTSTSPTSDELEAIQKRATLEQNIEDVDLRLSQLQLEDPALYERLIVERELEIGEGQQDSHY